MDFELVNFEQAAHLGKALADLLRRHCRTPSTAGNEQSAPRAIMLTGGNTVRTVYRYFTRAGALPAPPDLWVMGTDERHVPRDAVESNYRTMTPVFDTLQLPPERIMMPDSTLALEESAALYHEQLAGFFKAGGRISLAIMGIGTDGHIASLFNAGDVERGADRYAVAVERPDPPHRISVTPALLAKAELIVVFAAGAEKRRVLERFLAGAGDLPAVQALAGAPQVLVWFAAKV